MLHRILSIPNRMAEQAMASPLDRRGFLREIMIAGLISLLLPFIVFIWFLIIIYDGFALHDGYVAMAAFALALFGEIFLLNYAACRLNAATLARERSVIGAAAQQIHPPWKGPFLLRRSSAIGSTRSRIMAGFPTTLGFGLMIVVVYALTRESNLLVFLTPLALGLTFQIVTASKLLR